MTGQELYDAMVKLKLSVPVTARILGVNERTIYKWREHYDRLIPHSAGLVMQLLLRGKATFEDLDM